MQRWLLAFLAVAGVIVLSIRFVDLPLARRLAELGLLQALATRGVLAAPVMVVMAILAVVAGLRYLLARRPMPKYIESGMVAGWALMATVCLIELGLKPVFGRTVPWQFLYGGEHAFHFFHGTAADSSFPSGHSGQAAAILSVFWAYYPRWRWLYAAAMMVLAAMLMLGAWHFLSDILAGAFLGAVLGAFFVWLWRALKFAPRASAPPR